MPEKFNPDSFSAFLKSVKRSETPTVPAVSSPMELLKMLAAVPEKRLEVPDLLSRSEMAVEAFVRVLQSLEKAGLVRNEREESHEFVVLTPSGEQVAAVQP